MAHPTRLRHAVGEAIREQALWGPGDRVAVAVSGGRDSVCLLDLLVATAGWHQGDLQVVTVDHGTRRDSGDDATFVEALAASHGLPVQRIALDLGPSSEATMRQARYAAFDALDVDRVALGHHQLDQAETVMLQLLRGTGGAGRGGMRARRGRYVRPILEVSPERLDAWVRARGLTYRDDPSNTDPRFLRNRVRQEVMPLLESLRPGSTRALARSARHAAEDESLLRSLAQAATPASSRWPTSWWTTTPEPLARRVLLHKIPQLSAAHLDQVLRMARREAGTLHVAGWRIVADGTGVHFGSADDGG